MIAYQILDITNSNADAKKFTPSEEGKAMANIPNWIAFIDPNYASVEKGALNRVRNQDYWTSSTGKIPLGTFSNGEKCFAPTKDNLIQIRPNVDFPTQEWSVFFVAEMVEGLSQAENGPMQAIVTGDNSLDYAPAVRIFRSGTGFAVMKQGGLADGTRRLTLLDDTLKGAIKVYIATFSIKNGLSIYVNGIKKSSIAEVNPIINDFRAGKWSILRGCMSKVGYIGILGLDLNDATNEVYRNKINSFLMKKYAIV